MSCCQFLSKLDIVDAGAGGGEAVDGALRQVIHGQQTVGVVDEDEGQIINCLEHVSCCYCCFKIPQPPSRFLSLYRVMQALSLMMARANRRAAEAAQSACVTELE
jgi:hypothetical protein